MSRTPAEDREAFQRYYWRIDEEGSTSVDRSRATHVEIRIKEGQYISSFVFEIDKELSVWELTNAFEKVFRRGYAAAQVDIRQALGLA